MLKLSPNAEASTRMEGLIHRRGIANKESSEKRMRKKMPLEKGAFAESMEIVLINRSRFGLHHRSLKLTTGHAGGKTNITRCFGADTNYPLRCLFWAKRCNRTESNRISSHGACCRSGSADDLHIIFCFTDDTNVVSGRISLIRGGDSVGARVTDF